MAMVASALADGGVIMTPHVMDQIRDSDGNLVEHYQPTPWKQATSSGTAAH
jgi:peptidoglycan glycosyltransferase